MGCGMASDWVLSVPKWARKATIAILMVGAAQLLISLSECGHPEHAMGAARAPLAAR
jgi:hypothetical protein